MHLIGSNFSGSSQYFGSICNRSTGIIIMHPSGMVYLHALLHSLDILQWWLICSVMELWSWFVQVWWKGPMERVAPFKLKPSHHYHNKSFYTSLQLGSTIMTMGSAARVHVASILLYWTVEQCRNAGIKIVKPKHELNNHTMQQGLNLSLHCVFICP